VVREEVLVTFVRLVPTDRLAQLEKIEETARVAHGCVALDESTKARTELRRLLGLITEKEYQEVRAHFDRKR